MGATTGPQKLADMKRAKGTERWSGVQRSVSEPPELATAGEPKNPAAKRNTSRADIFGDRAQGRFHKQKHEKVE